jgi:hypothetical protein
MFMSARTGVEIPNGVTAIPIGATASINTIVPALSAARMINVLCSNDCWRGNAPKQGMLSLSRPQMANAEHNPITSSSRASCDSYGVHDDANAYSSLSFRIRAPRSWT